MKKFMIALIIVLMLVGCKAYYTEEAWGRDTIYSVEITKRGYYRIWFTHDDVSAYCTVDQELGKKAINLLLEHDGEVTFRYSDSEWFDAEADVWSNTKCGEGIYETKTWILLDIDETESRIFR